MINIQQLRFNYQRSLVYDDFSLALAEPGIYGLFGRNGSGKSTLLKILSGLLFPNSGAVEVMGYRPSDRLPELLENIYIVPEEFHLPNITLATLQKTHAPFYPRFSSSHFRTYADTFEVPWDRQFESMSLGQKKKAVIAFALATHTPLLLMDEPTNGLDILGRSQFKSIMRGTEHTDRLVMISTHQAHDLETLMKHVLFVDAGKLALSASMKTLQQTLQMGVVDAGQPIEHSVYVEAIGNQQAYVARNVTGRAGTIHLELLYKALSMNKQSVLDIVSGCPNTGALS